MIGSLRTYYKRLTIKIFAWGLNIRPNTQWLPEDSFVYLLTMLQYLPMDSSFVPDDSLFYLRCIIFMKIWFIMYIICCTTILRIHPLPSILVIPFLLDGDPNILMLLQNLMYCKLIGCKLKLQEYTWCLQFLNCKHTRSPSLSCLRWNTHRVWGGLKTLRKWNDSENLVWASSYFFEREYNGICILR